MAIGDTAATAAISMISPNMRYAALPIFRVLALVLSFGVFCVGVARSIMTGLHWELHLACWLHVLTILFYANATYSHITQSESTKRVSSILFQTAISISSVVVSIFWTFQIPDLASLGPIDLLVSVFSHVFIYILLGFDFCFNDYEFDDTSIFTVSGTIITFGMVQGIVLASQPPETVVANSSLLSFIFLLMYCHFTRLCATQLVYVRNRFYSSDFSSSYKSETEPLLQTTDNNISNNQHILP